jgi:hypothetical protein
VIHIATVHWKSSRWIDVQLRYLERHLSSPYRVYACLNEIAGDRGGELFFSTRDQGDHAQSLNHLAGVIAEGGDGDDVLVFLDGDAFPIAPLDEPLRAFLAARPLAAIRRDENGDVQPHPSFCATTIGGWRELGGDWSKGDRTWKNAQGDDVTDVGAKVLKALEQKGADWTPVLRTNVVDLHPVLFGVYGDLIYHHGGGFRASYTRADDAELRPQADSLPGRPFDRGRHYADLRIRRAADNAALGEKVWERIERDEDFARKLFL